LSKTAIRCANSGALKPALLTGRNAKSQRDISCKGFPLDEALQFQKQQADTFPLSDVARAFIQKSRRQRQRSRLKTASWLMIPALLIGGIVEYNLREISLKNNYDRIVEQEGTPVEKEAVEDRVAGCSQQVTIHKRLAWLDVYLTERLFGNCRLLTRAPLSSADLSSADLNNANLRSTDLNNAISDPQISITQSSDPQISITQSSDPQTSGTQTSGTQTSET
jgi:hypothetical protein